MANQFVTLASYNYATEFYILVAKLEAEGINCFLKNEKTISTDPLLSNAAGGIDVQVMEEDLKKAKMILQNLNEANKPSAILGKDYEKVLIYCPTCESINVFRKKGPLFSFGAKEHICIDCNHKWKQ